MSEGRLPRPVMRDEFRDSLRLALMREAAVTPLQRRTRSPLYVLFHGTRRALSLAAIVLLLAVVTTTSALASVPGDPAYAVKRGFESLQVAFVFDDTVRAQLLAAQADQRLKEFATVADAKPANAGAATTEYSAAVARLAEAIDTLRADESPAKREKAEEVADKAKDKHLAVLEELKEHVTPDVRPAIERAIKEAEKINDPGRTPKPPRGPTRR